MSAAHPPTQIRLGPYHLRVQFMSQSRMSDRRRLACVNIEDGRLELRGDLRGERLAEALFESIVRLTHFSKGCQQGCVEEAYTHALATGLVEFAQRNRPAWAWFNSLLAKHASPGAQYDRVVDGLLSRPPLMPTSVRIAGHRIALRSISRNQSAGAFGWYVMDDLEAQLYGGLTGSNLAIVALHEITHAVHHVYGLRDRDRHHNFRSAQVRGWLSIIRRDPLAWRWLIWIMSFPAQASIVAQPQSPAARRAQLEYAI